MQKPLKFAKKAYKEGRPVVDVAEENTDLSRGEYLFCLILPNYPRRPLE